MNRRLIASLIAMTAFVSSSALAALNPHVSEAFMDIVGFTDSPDGAEASAGDVIAMGSRKEIKCWVNVAGRASLSWASTKIKVYNTASGGTALTSPVKYDATTTPRSLFVEGVSISSGPADETLLFEALHTTPYPHDIVAFTVYKVETVSGKTEIAAGALNSAPHQTYITVHVTPAVSASVAVWLVDGDGFKTGSPETYSGHSLIVEGPAKIEGSGLTFISGGSTPSSAAIVVNTDSDGDAVLTLTSSNEINETCKVHAKANTVPPTMTGSEASCIVKFLQGDQTITLPDYLPANTEITAIVKRSLGGVALPGHDTVFYVSSVKVNGTTILFNYTSPTALDVYAKVVSGDERKPTDSSGEAKAHVKIMDVSGLENVEVSSRDLQTFDAP